MTAAPARGDPEGAPEPAGGFGVGSRRLVENGVAVRRGGIPIEDLGLVDDARAHLGRALATNPYLTMRDRPAADELADSLGLSR